MALKPRPMTTPADRSRIDTAPAGELCRVAKVDSELGLVIGFGAVCTEKGADYYDLHGDHLPEDEMVKATVDFMKSARSAKVQHAGEDVGQVVCAFPMSREIFKALFDGAEPPRSGVIIGWQPTDKALLKKFADGEFTGFSFGGSAYRDEVVP